METLFTVLLICLGINGLMFILAYMKRTDHFTDITYAVTFIVALFYALISTEFTLPKLILYAMICLWAIRLGAYLFIRIKSTGKDWRFDDKRGNFWSFGGFWLLQGLSIFVLSIPAVLYINSTNTSLDVLSYLGMTTWAAGLLIQTTADLQKYRFKKNPDANQRWIETGLWKFSRHPNYLGEILVWLGLYVYTINSLSPIESLISFVSPLYITLLLLFVSGVPFLKKKALAKFGSDPDYQLYLKNTGTLLPKGTWMLVFFVLITQGIGSLGAFFTETGLQSWYLTLEKPSWNPPDWVFAPVWIALYTLIGIATFLIWKNRKEYSIKFAMLLYVVQLVLNLSWTLIFFKSQSPMWAFLEIIILLLVILSMIRSYYKINRFAGLLLIPYLLWVFFATILNGTLWFIN